VLRLFGLISDARWERLQKLDREAICWDLSRGLPFADSSFDVVYHSHVLEHIDREAAPAFLGECFRVLKPGGVVRIVVPDLELLLKAYGSAVGRLEAGDDEGAWMREHDRVLDDLFDQMVRRVPVGRRSQPPILRWLENWLVGDTARSGVQHRWMYDRFSLSRLLDRCGFEDMRVMAPTESGIDGWAEFHLDTEPDGAVYKPGSLYVEARRPGSRGDGG
jgi:SAM-dependent methyltransferase